MKPLSSLTLRLLSSLVLIPVAIGAIYMGGWIYAGFIGLCIAIALHEWMGLSQNISIRAAGAPYLLMAAASMIALRQLPEGIEWTIFFMLAIWASDSGAYLFGKTIGGPKMSPTISPNKTWAGYIGALVSPAFVLLICVHVLTPISLIEHTPSPIFTFLAGLCIGIAGQSGDLLISAMKRKMGIKDTGHLIPGHGGILDRIDAMIMALPVYVGFVEIITS